MSQQVTAPAYLLRALYPPGFIICNTLSMAMRGSPTVSKHALTQRWAADSCRCRETSGGAKLRKQAAVAVWRSGGKANMLDVTIHRGVRRLTSPLRWQNLRQPMRSVSSSINGRR